MLVTYIGHSGFLVELENCYLLFDYYKGSIPELNPGKKLFVFASHKHADHYNPEIFKLHEKHPDMEFILSSDIKPSAEHRKEAGEGTEAGCRIRSVKPLMEYVLYDREEQEIILKTLKSTDCGVAFLLHYGEKTIYHAGDLNQWVWKGESKQYNNGMTSKFLAEINRLNDVPIDVAFAPLDPRLEDWYYMGMLNLLKATRIRYVFPMHFWDKPTVIRKFIEEHAEDLGDARVMEISQDGQQWNLQV